MLVSAFQLPPPGGPPEDFLAWAEQVGFYTYTSGRDESIEVTLASGEVVGCEPGDWVVKQGEEYVVKTNEEFEQEFAPENPEDLLGAVTIVGLTGMHELSTKESHGALHLPIQDWVDSVKAGGYKDFDGQGFLASEKEESYVEVSPSFVVDGGLPHIPDWATHVVWYPV